jgi:hypothetical protein
MRSAAASNGGLIADVELEDSRVALDARRGPPPCSRFARSDEHGGTVRRQILGDLETDSPVAPVTKPTTLSCITNLALVELAGSGLDLCGGCTLVRLGVPLTFTSVSQKQRDRWLGPNVGPKRLLGTARGPGVA